MRIPFEQELDPYLADRLKRLRGEYDRQSQKAAIVRANYLAEVKIMAQEDEARATGSRIRITNRRAWIGMIPHYRKGSLPAMATLSSLVIIITLLFGAVSASVYAAQDSLPTDFLYPLKVLGEELHLALTLNPNTRMALLLRHSMGRLDEMLEMVTNQEPFPEKVVFHWQDNIALALQKAAQMEDPAMFRALEQIRLHLSLQERRLQAVQACENAELNVLRARLRLIKGVVEGALEDPVAFRLRWKPGCRLGDQFPLDNPIQATPDETLPPFDQGSSQGDSSIQPSLDPGTAIGLRKRSDRGQHNLTSSPDPALLNPVCAEDCMPTTGGVEHGAKADPIRDYGNDMPAVDSPGHNSEGASRKDTGTTSQGDREVDCSNKEERGGDSARRFGGGSGSP